MNKSQGPPRWEVWARFRFSIIGGLLASPPERGELQKELKKLSSRTYKHPFRENEWLRPNFSTIERWYYKAKDANDPIAALGRKIRRDAGQTKAMSAELLDKLEAQYKTYPNWTVQLHYDNLTADSEENSQTETPPSYQTIRRSMQERGWTRRRTPANPTDGHRRALDRLEKREVRSFEASHVHGLWHLDFHQGSIKVLDAKGRWHSPFALAILDDCSRLACHIQWYLAETAECLVHGMIQAFLKRGLPRALMSDNGAAMLAEETRQGLARLGVLHETTLPYSAYQNGKQEVFWAQLEGRLLACLKSATPLKLAFLNKATQAWAEQDYHRRKHSELNATPLERMLAGPNVGRACPDTETLRLAFTRQIVRTQRRSDGTLTVDGVRYEVPSRFRTLRKLQLRYPGWDKSELMLVDERTGTPIGRLLPQDKRKNGSSRRRTLESLKIENNPSTSPVSLEYRQTKSEPLPAIVRKWLADYAATGLPPAYCPKEELENTDSKKGEQDDR